MHSTKVFSLEEAIHAQQALRAAAGLGPEEFPIQAFVGMVSDEIDHLRRMGRNDDEIAAVIRQNSGIEITGAEIAENYATPEERQASNRQS